MGENYLYYGDNYEVLQRHIPSESVDLIYLDPPFNSNQNYNAFFDEKDGTRSAAQIQAFTDTWTWDEDAARSYEHVVEQGGAVATAMRSFRLMLGDNDLLAYLSMMAPRLKELHRVLKPTGSLYLHCDPTASHYLKMLLDAVFGPKRFQNEIIWWYRKWSKSPNRFLRNHDVILFYAKEEHHTFNLQYVPLAESTLKRFGGKRQDFADETRTRKITTEEESLGAFMPDVWPIALIPANSAERLGYPTQKPIALLETIIKASSNPGDVVLDPFCGCGTAVDAAQRLGRSWVGIDITSLAINLIKGRLRSAYGPNVTFKVRGEPVNLIEARELAESEPYDFQWWALGLVGARGVGRENEKKGADRGIDGRLYFHDDNSGETKQIIFSVKAGKVNVSHVRDLRGVIDREDAQIGVLISMEEPTKPMRAEAASAGFYKVHHWGEFPRIQLLTIEELLDGKSVQMPPSRANITLRQAKKVKNTPHQPMTLDLDLDG